MSSTDGRDPFEDRRPLNERLFAPWAGGRPVPEPNDDLTPLTPSAQPMPRTGPMPRSVVNAIRAIYAQVVFRVIGLLLLIITIGSYKEKLIADRPNLSQAQVDHIGTVTIIAGSVVTGLFIVVYLVAAVNIARGRNWARIVTWVVSAIGLLSGLSALTGTSTGLDKGFAVINILLDAAIIVFLAMRPNRSWFR